MHTFHAKPVLNLPFLGSFKSIPVFVHYVLQIIQPSSLHNHYSVY